MSKMSIFVSHTSVDTTFALSLVDVLRSAEADVWFDELNLGFQQITSTIELELRTRRVFIVILSKAALASE